MAKIILRASCVVIVLGNSGIVSNLGITAYRSSDIRIVDTALAIQE